MLSPERFAAIDELFRRVLDAEADRRAALLEAHRDDPELVREVERLLALDQSEAPTLESLREPDAPIRRILTDLVPGAGAGDRTGAYRLVAPIGHGGMGIVWRAERADGAFEQQVALKLLPPGTLSASAIRRFERERQILADLDHENIARLLDGGVDDKGQPFLAMELVEGRTIVEHCDADRLGIAARVDLVVAVARAIGAAHRSLVVHCDLKPANILVTPEGRVKLLDFGIAEILDAEVREDLGGRGLRRLTPEYASPELLAGGSPTTASDVYQLGLLAYELLGGRRPRPVCEGPLEDWIAGVLARGLPPPSSLVVEGADAIEIAVRRRTTPRRLQRSLRGDLDAILARATKPHPGDRYPSAEALARDLERYRQGYAVEARNGGLWYRAGRQVRRYPAVTALAALLVVLLVGLAAQTIDARRAREAAEEQAASASSLAREKQEVADFLVSLLTDASFENQGEELSVWDLLDRGVERSDLDATLAASSRTELEEILARVYFRLGGLNESLTLLQSVVEERRSGIGGEGKLAESVLRLAWSHIALAHHDEAKRLLSEARTYYEGRSEPEARRSLALVLTRLSYVHGMLGELEPMLVLRHQSLELRRQLYGADHLEVAQALNDLCFAYRDIGSYSRAREYCVQALDLRRAYEDWSQVAHSELNLSLVELALGRFESADRWSRRGLERVEEVYPAGHFRQGRALITRARVLVPQGRLDEAGEALKRARAIYALHFPDDYRELAYVARLEAQIDLARGRPADARPRLEWALDILRRDHDENQHTILQTRIVLAETLLALGEWARARETLVDVERRLAPGRTEEESWLRRSRDLLSGIQEVAD